MNTNVKPTYEELEQENIALTLKLEEMQGEGNIVQCAAVVEEELKSLVNVMRNMNLETKLPASGSKAEILTLYRKRLGDIGKLWGINVSLLPTLAEVDKVISSQDPVFKLLFIIFKLGINVCRGIAKQGTDPVVYAKLEQRLTDTKLT